jgi:hypothetical protein
MGGSNTAKKSLQQKQGITSVNVKNDCSVCKNYPEIRGQEQKF